MKKMCCVTIDFVSRGSRGKCTTRVGEKGPEEPVGTPPLKVDEKREVLVMEGSDDSRRREGR